MNSFLRKVTKNLRVSMFRLRLTCSGSSLRIVTSNVMIPVPYGNAPVALFASCSTLTAKGTENIDHECGNDSPRFIPMTRRTLLRKLMEEESLVPTQDHLDFQKFAAGLDRAISRSFYGVLNDLKALYDPLNPDKETMVVGKIGRKEKMDKEFWLLQKLAKLLDAAHFIELPRPVIAEALKEHPAFEGVLVSVDTSKYDVLRFWILGREYGKLEVFGIDRLFLFIKSFFQKSSKQVLIYKRVVLAVRTKKQGKLSLKAFKDIPSNSLEYLLPEGRIRMSKADKGIIATTVTIGLTSGLIKLVTSLTSYHIQMTYIAGAVTAILALRAWNAYKNKRNSYLVNLSKLLYYKTVANNRALLALIVDRTEDELFKSTLIAYTFLRAAKRMTYGEDPGDVLFSSGRTAEELKFAVESWMMERFKLSVTYDPCDAISQLTNHSLLQEDAKAEEKLLSVLDLKTSIQKLPVPQDDSLLERQEELDIDHILAENDFEADEDARIEENKNDLDATWN